MTENTVDAALANAKSRAAAESSRSLYRGVALLLVALIPWAVMIFQGPPANPADQSVYLGMQLVFGLAGVLLIPIAVWRLIRHRAAPRSADVPSAAAPAGDATPDDDVPSTGILLLTEFQSRVRHRELQAFLQAFNGTCESFATQSDGRQNGHIQVACALRPGRRMVLECQTIPQDVLPAARVAELANRLRQFPTPAVSSPVAFVVRTRVGDGTPGVRFQFPFMAGSAAVARDEFDEFLMRLGEPQDSTSASGAPWTSAEYGSLLEFDPGNVLALVGRSELHYSAERYDEAFADLDRAIEFSPNDADLYAQKADLLVDRGRDAEALTAFNKALGIDANHVWARHGRAMHFKKQNDAVRALADIRHALQVKPEDADLHVSLGLVHASAEDFDSAIDALTRAITINRESAVAWYERAKLRLLREEFELAADDLGEAIRCAPHSAIPCALRAQVYVQLQRPDDALADLSLAVEREPQRFDFRLQRARLYGQTGKFTLAIDDLTAILDHDPDCAEAWALRGVAHQELDEYEPAIADCSEAVERGVELSQVYFNRAAAYHSTGQLELALADIERVLELDAENALAYNARGIIHLQRDEFDEAIEDFTAAVGLAPEWAVPFFQRGNAHASKGELRQAIDEYGEAIELQPDLAVAHKNRGTAYAQLDELEKAHRDYTEAVELDPDLLEAWFERATVRMRQSDYAGAVADLDRVLALNSEFVPAYFARANAWRLQGNAERALSDLDTLIRLCPTLGAAYSARGSVWVERGEHDKATEDFAEATRLDPASAEAFVIQRILVEAAWHHRNKAFDRAIEKATEAIEFSPDCSAAYSVRAAANWYSGRLVEAADDYTTLIDMPEEARDALGSRGQVYAEMGEFEVALTDLNRVLGAVVSTGVPRAYVLSGRALALAGLGRFDEARVDFEASILERPANAWVHYNHGLVYHTLGEDHKAAICFELALALDEPRLTPLKRRRAEAFLQKHPVTNG
jgi:tetratricopeptide (TPR) repeat protein